MRSISRREVIGLGIGAMAMLATGTPGETRRPSSMLRPIHPDFRNMLVDKFPGISELPLFNQLLPYSAIIHNRSGNDAFVYHYGWRPRMVNNNNEAVYSKLFFRPIDLDGWRIASIAEEPVLQAGDFAFVTPVSLFSSLEWRRRGQGQGLDFQRALRAHPRAQRFIWSTSEVPRIQMKRLGKVIIADASEADDKNGQYLTIRRNSERRAAINALEWLRLNPTAISTEFTNWANGMSTSVPPEEPQYQRSYYKMLAFCADKHSFDALYPRLRRVALRSDEHWVTQHH